jgi:CelD/BcsL family acetyltransferase involved in cellulose biosynthesis
MSLGPSTLIQSHAAHELLNNQKFIEQWSKLLEKSPYATGFQEPAFACAWYESYRENWHPIIIYCPNSNEELTGLWLLAYNPENKLLVHVGDNQAEYHIWLALPGTEVSFLASAWKELVKQLDFSILRFRYLPVAEPLGSILKCIPELRHVAIRKRLTPLMVLDANEIKSSFAKKSNKSRFNRLKRLGLVEFRKIRSISELESVFDELIDFYDLRQGAVNNARPFQYDAIKRKFHIETFRKSVDKIHVTVTFLNGKPVAGLWGTITRGTIHIGLIMHSPFLAEHSLGKLHIMQLSQLMLSENLNVLDLTPGSDPWKDRFANKHGEVAEAIIYRSNWLRKRNELAYRTLNTVRNLANRMGISSAELKTIMVTVREVSPARLVVNFLQWIWSDRKHLIYQIDRLGASKFQSDTELKVDSINDVMLFDHRHERKSGSSFLSSALHRFEQGEHIYTTTSNGLLAYCAWVFGNESRPALQLSSNDVTVHDIYIHSSQPYINLFRSALQNIVLDLFKNDIIHRVYIIVPIRNSQYKKCVEELGFVFQLSFINMKRFGKERIQLSSR